MGFISQGRLVALDAPARLKQNQLRGELPLDEVALYGAQIHVVVPAHEQYRSAIRQALEAASIPIISAVSATQAARWNY